MILFRLTIMAAVLGVVCAPHPVVAAGAKDKLNKVETQIDAQEAAKDALDQKAKDAADNLKDLQHKLIAATETLQSKGEEEDRLQEKLDQLEDDIAAKNNALGGERQKLDALTRAMVDLSREPPQAMFLQSDLSTDHIHRAILLRAILPRLTEQTENIAQDLTSLGTAQTQLTEQKRLVAAAQDNMQDQQRSLDQLIKARQGLLQRTEEQKAAIAAQLVALSSGAKDLHQLLDKVAPKQPVKPGATIHAPSNLKWPVSGNILKRFGDHDADGVVSQGLTFAALPGSPVVAPRAGKVVFAGLFRGYGQILILQHDGGYHSFLSGFGRIDAEMGQEVETGEPLGVLPVKSGAKPELYFEWRHNSDPINPAG
jgi:septal ring factor EnvC (AmiA/AmiB activator)